MFVHKNLTFPHKAILTSSMLEEIYSYPREFSRLLFGNLGDGIISGLDYSLKDGELILSAGIFHADNEFYFLSRDVNVSELADKNNLSVDREYFIALEKKSSVAEQCVTKKVLELTFAEKKSLYTLGQFVFLRRKDFQLPTLDKMTLDEMFNRSVFNLFDVPFAAKGVATFHPQLFRQVKNFLQGKPDKTPRDFAILTYLQNNEVISVETMTDYLAAENKVYDVADREDFFRKFLTCLSETKNISEQSPAAVTRKFKNTPHKKGPVMI